jgi:hypothetical protein
MRLAVISHIHGNLLALEAVIADIGTRGVDATVLYALEYGWDQAALRARDRGFPKWAEALATGAVT